MTETRVPCPRGYSPAAFPRITLPVGSVGLDVPRAAPWGEYA
jgi:hypothetical protein